MKIKSLVKTLSILSYCLIMINGSIIAIPFIIYLISASISIFYLEGINQSVTSLISIVGLIIIIKHFKEETFKSVFISFLGFLMLLVPLIERLSSISIELFNYLSFKIPVILFVVLFFIYMFISIFDYYKNKKILNSQQLSHSK
jgi:hypothetical protein